MKNETHQKRSFLSRLTALLLVVVLLFNMNAAALPVHAVESTNKWASSPKDNLNTLPSYAKGGNGVDRQPDVGTAASKGGEISSTAENKTEAAIQDQTVTVNRLGGTVTLSPKGGSFDRAAYTDCAVRYQCLSQYGLSVRLRGRGSSGQDPLGGPGAADGLCFFPGPFGKFGSEIRSPGLCGIQGPYPASDCIQSRSNGQRRGHWGGIHVPDGGWNSVRPCGQRLDERSLPDLSSFC